MRDRDKLIILLSVIGSLICLNVLAERHFLRVDLTRDKAFTLSQASKETMRSLEDPLSITAYFTKNLPPPFAGIERDVRDLLEEYRVASKGMLSFEFIDPEEAETKEDKEKKKEVKRDIFGRVVREPTSIERELQGLGIQPVQINVIEEDQAQQKRAYMGLVIRYQEEHEVLPVVQSTEDLEYQLTTLIRNLTRTRVPVLGVVQGHGEPSLEKDLSRLSLLLEQVYEVKPVNLKEHVEKEDAVPLADEYDALLVVGPEEAFTEKELRALDQFLMRGKSAAFLLDKVSVDFATFQTKEVDHGLSELLSTYGIDLGHQLVADAECASLTISRRMGSMLVQMPMRYPFIPQLRKLEGESPVTRGLAEITIPFATPVFLSSALEEEGSKRRGEVLARSSSKSWLEEATSFNLSPQRFLERVEATFTGPYNLVATVSGTLPSHFASEANSVSTEEGAILVESEGEARVLVAGSSGLARDPFMSAPNAAFVMNIVDWLLLDPALLTMRTRGLIDPPLDPELSDTARSLVKYGNVIGVPLALGVLGLFAWQARATRRRRLMSGEG